jgi:hypothetical protein
MREQGKGWGLISVDGVKKGNLVQEYVGEVIDQKTKEERLAAWTDAHPNDDNFYVMALKLQPGWYIDARENGNMARFINHSCDPNCKLVPMNVAGHIRVAIVCLKDVPPGTCSSMSLPFDTTHQLCTHSFTAIVSYRRVPLIRLPVWRNVQLSMRSC